MKKLSKILLTICIVTAVFSSMVYYGSEFLTDIHRPALSQQRQAQSLLKKNHITCTAESVVAAIRTGDIDTLQTLYIAGENIHLSALSNSPTLHLAIEHDQWQVAELLKLRGSDLNTPDQFGDVPLAKILAQNNLQKAQQFIDAGAAVDFLTSIGEPALITYLKAANRPIITFLLANGADPNTRDSKGHTALNHSLRIADLQSFNQLLQAGASTKDVTIEGESLIIAVLENDELNLPPDERLPLISTLISAGVDPGLISIKSGLDPLQIAIIRGNIPLIEHLLNYTPDSTPYLWLALDEQKFSAAKTLLKHGALPDHKNSSGLTPIVAMTDQNRPSMITALLDHGADPEQLAPHGQRLIFYAIARNHTEATLALLGHAKSPDIKLPMDYPISKDFRSIFGKKSYLDWNLRSVAGHNPYTLAILSKNVKVAEQLIKMGVSRHTRTTTKMYPIQFAAGTNDVPMLQLILGAPYQDDKQVRNFIIDLSEQKVYFYKNGELRKSSRCSTGRSGYRTPTGTYVITDKTRHKVSNIYKGAKMPYFQRFSCSAIGFHTGNTGSRYASHGCIRLPNSTASFFFKYSKVGDRVTIRK